MKIFRHVHCYHLALISLLLLTACEPQQTQPNPQQAALTQPTQPLTPSPFPTNDAIKAFIVQANSNANASINTAIALQQASENFLKNPNNTTLKALKSSWQISHQQYLRTIIYQSVSKNYRRSRFQIDAWPIEAGYLDYLKEYPNTGIVNDLTLVISEEAITEQHGFSSEFDVCKGFHAIEFLIWGEGPDPNSVGNRSAKDFLPMTSLTQQQQENQLQLKDLANNRRRELLRLLVNLLIKDLSELEANWQSSGSYSQQLVSLPPRAQIKFLVENLDRYLRREILEKSLGDSAHGEYSNTGVDSWLAHAASLAEIYNETDQPILAPLFNKIDEKQNQILAALLTELGSALQTYGQDLKTANNTTAAEPQALRNLIDTLLTELGTLADAIPQSTQPSKPKPTTLSQAD